MTRGLRSSAKSPEVAIGKPYHVDKHLQSLTERAHPRKPAFGNSMTERDESPRVDYQDDIAVSNPCRDYRVKFGRCTAFYYQILCLPDNLWGMGA